MTYSAPLEGVITALITPFKNDKSIDWDAFERLLAKQAAAKVDGIVICGTTGEAPTLSVQEKLSLIRRARATLDSGIQVIAGTGGSDTQQSIELSKLAIDAGANALLVVTPPYNKPSQEGLQLHFSMIAEATKCPIILYHVPGRTAQRLSAGEMASLCHIPELVAIKEASADLTLFAQTKLASPDTALLSGDDFTYLPSLAVGGQGIISVLSNVFPEALVAMTQAFKEGKNDRALAYHEALFPMMEILFCESNPCPVKAALAMDDLCQNILRPPLVPVKESNFSLIKQTMRRTKEKLQHV